MSFLSTVGTFILRLLGQRAAQTVILEILSNLTKQTDNTVDDQLVAVVRLAFANQRDTSSLLTLLNTWTSDDEKAEIVKKTDDEVN